MTQIDQEPNFTYTEETLVVEKFYFATDGNYGPADGILIVSVEELKNFSEDDWNLIEMMEGESRPETVQHLLNRNK